MFGGNVARKQVLDDGQQLWVQEVFYTLQGEGPWTGHPSIFVRLAGCNLKCFWCDTDFESSNGSRRSTNCCAGLPIGGRCSPISSS